MEAELDHYGDKPKLPHLRVDHRTMAALHDEAVRRSAETGKPIFPRALAARILDDWAKARSADIAKSRATRALQNAEG